MRWLVLCYALGASLLVSTAQIAWAQKGENLQLEVTINGTPTGLIGSFSVKDGQELWADYDELVELGIMPPKEQAKGALRLKSLGVNYTYRKKTQSVELVVPPNLLKPKTIDVVKREQGTQVERGWGAFANYGAYLGADVSSGKPHLSSLSLDIDSTIFSPLGNIETQGLWKTDFNNLRYLPLSTNWYYSDTQSLTTYRAGDLISGSIPWARPVRLGGFQIQRNFALRPDLITLPLPSLNGSAAVPAALDVYLGDYKSYSTTIPTGPYQVQNIPFFSGAGPAHLVVTDVTGHQVLSDTSFIADGAMLAKGYVDFSAELGMPHLYYGTKPFEYDHSVVGSTTVRYGLTDSVTVQGHVETGKGLRNISGGLRASIFEDNLVSIAAGNSQHRSASGSLLYASLDIPRSKVVFHASSQRTFGIFRDLAQVTAPVNISGFNMNAYGGLYSASFPREVDVASLSYRFGRNDNVSIGFINTASDISRVKLINAGYSTTLFDRYTLYLNAFHELSRGGSDGVYLSLSAKLDDNYDASISTSVNGGAASLTADIARPLGVEPGSIGGRLSVSEFDNAYRSGYAALRTSYGVGEVSAYQAGSYGQAYAAFNGSVAFFKNSLKAGDRIQDAFALVDAGVPNVRVFRDNQPIGTTAGDGRLLVTGLNAYQTNRISIDPLDFPLTADISKTNLRLTPADHAGVFADFGVSTSKSSAQVILKNTAGEVVSPGARGKNLSSGEEFVVGYDGMAYLKNLMKSNILSVLDGARECRVSFDYIAKPGVIGKVGPLSCN